MAKIGLGFQLSANATQMSAGINAGVVELQKLGYAAKKTASDVSALKNIEIGRAFISAVSTVTRTFTQFTSGAANAVDSTAKLARSLGISYQELQQLQIAADLSGASSEQLAAAFTRASVTITEAAAGSKTARADLAALGLSVEDLAGKSTNVQFGILADAITKIENPAQRAAAAVSIFGRSGAQLLPTFAELRNNLSQSSDFLAKFGGGLNDAQAKKVEEINDAFTLVRKSIEQVAANVLVELNPALVKGAESIVDFAASLDVSAIAKATRDVLADVADALGLVASVAAPLATNLFPAIGGYLAFINRQAIGSGIASLGRVFVAAAGAALGYSGAAANAAAATVALGVAVRGLLVSTGIGALVVLLGAAAGSLVDWSVSGRDASENVALAIEEPSSAVRRFRAQMRAATVDAADFGDKVKQSLRVPGEISIREFAQGSLDEARSAIVSLAKELGGLDRVPKEFLASFQQIANYAKRITSESNAEFQALGLVDSQAKELLATVNALTSARKAEAEAIKQVADEAKRASEEASRDARRRVQDLADAGMTDADRSRLTLSEDMLAISRTIADAEEQLNAARRAGDSVAIASARERLELTKQTAAAAERTAQQQARERALALRGIDVASLQAPRTLEDQVKAIKDAFQAGEVTRPEAISFLKNLAADAIKIRRDLAAELSTPSQRALDVADLRTQQGAASYLAAVTGRADPAIEQRRQQLDELKRIRDAIGRNIVVELG